MDGFGWMDAAAQEAWPIVDFKGIGRKAKSQGKGEKVALYPTAAAAICQTSSVEDYRAAQ